MNKYLAAAIAIFVSTAATASAFARQIETQDKPPQQPQQNSSVESFFQINPAGGGLRNDETSVSEVSESTCKTKRSFARQVGACLWHILDFAGVPMILTKYSGEIDSGIVGSAEITSPPLPSEAAARSSITQTVVEVKQTPPKSEPSPGLRQKIPEAELEGTIYQHKDAGENDAPAP